MECHIWQTYGGGKGKAKSVCALRGRPCRRVQAHRFSGGPFSINEMIAGDLISQGAGL